MSLWDAFSGRIYRWNLTKTNADNFVRNSLREVYASAVAKEPEFGRVYRHARNNLYAFYFGANDVVMNAANTGTAEFKYSVWNLTPEAYLRVLSSMHAGVVVGEYLRDRETPGNDARMVLRLEWMCSMYGRRDVFARDWLAAIDWLLEAPNWEFRLAWKIRNEFADFVGAACGRDVDDIYWLQLAASATSIMRQLESAPDWDELVTKALASR